MNINIAVDRLNQFLRQEKTLKKVGIGFNKYDLQLLLNMPKINNVSEYKIISKAVKLIFQGQEEKIKNDPETWYEIGSYVYDNNLDFWDISINDYIQKIDHILLFPHLISVIQSNDLKYWHKLAELLWEIDELEKSIIVLNYILSIDPKHVPCKTLLGIILLSQHKSDAGETHLLKAVEIDPTQGEASFELGKYYRNNNKMDEAEDYFLKSKGKSGGITLEDLLEFYEEIGDNNKIIEYHLKLVKLYPDNEYYKNNLKEFLQHK